MAKTWNYAEMSKAAKKAGGPEEYVKILEHASRDEGKLEMLPWIGVASLFSALLTAMGIKGINYFKSRKQRTQVQLEEAKQEIIAGIKTYDVEHAPTDNQTTD